MAGVITSDAAAAPWGLAILAGLAVLSLAAWLALDKEALRGEVLRVPTREEIGPFVNEQLVVELYSK